MSDTTNDGGPAFPVVASNGLGHVADGMSLRDWFAGQALITISERWRAVDAARMSYEYADAMLEAREGKK